MLTIAIFLCVTLALNSFLALLTILLLSYLVKKIKISKKYKILIEILGTHLCSLINSLAICMIAMNIIDFLFVFLFRIK